MLKGLMGGLARWLENEKPSDKRRAPRAIDPSLMVYYWDGSVPEGRKLRDISSTGAYIVTPERWYVGTIVRLILQDFKTASVPAEGIVSSRSTSIPSRVVRHGDDGIGVEFLFTTPEEQKALQDFISSIPQGMTRRVEGLTAVKGQALIEFALVLPIVFLLIVNAVNFGAFLFAWITVASSARTGAQYSVMGTASVGSVATPTPAQVTTLITSDAASLINRASLVVRICTNTNGTIACSGGGAYTPPADPEPGNYVLTSVDVAYTYLPLIPLWDFPGLGIHATLPATTIHRQVSMRVLK
jgi:Flp pilus assembly protein TadG